MAWYSAAIWVGEEDAPSEVRMLWRILSRWEMDSGIAPPCVSGFLRGGIGGGFLFGPPVAEGLFGQGSEVAALRPSAEHAGEGFDEAVFGDEGLLADLTEVLGHAEAA